MEKNKKQIGKDQSTKLITRQEAIKKAGITVLAATSLVFLKTKASASVSGGKSAIAAQKKAAGGGNEAATTPASATP